MFTFFKSNSFIEFKDTNLVFYIDLKDLLNLNEYDNLDVLTDEFVTNFSLLILPKNDPIEFLKFYPGGMELHDLLVELEMFYPSEEIDYSLYIEQDIATPESKLYYPEPFIASPSFVHEEIWFIHILHYNY